MITIRSGKMIIPEEERFIGFAGDNLHVQKQFLLYDVDDEDIVYRLYLTFDDGTVNYFLLDSAVSENNTILTWIVSEEDIRKSGLVNAQIKVMCKNFEIYHTTSDYFLVGESAEFSEYFSNKENSEFLRYEKELNTLLSEIKSIDTSSYVHSSRTIAGLDLSKDISDEELKSALNVQSFGLLSTVPTKHTIGNYRQLMGVVTDDNIESLYLCMGEQPDGSYKWLMLKNSNTDADLSEYVKNTLTIAGIDLADNITADELQTALGVYPVIELENAPDMTSQELEVAGKVGQIGVYANRESMEFYRCTSVTKHPQYEDEFIYEWEYLGSNANLEHLPYSSNDAPLTSFKDTLGYMKYFAGDKTLWLKTYNNWLRIPLFTDVENKVDKTTTIAGIDLEDDITADELRTALDVKGKIITRSTLPPANDLETVAEVGDFWLISKDQALYVCYGKQATENGYANYFWLSLTDYLKDDTTLAGLNLANNISAEQLQKKLNTYPVLIWLEEPTTSTVGSQGQLLIYKGINEQKLYYCSGVETDEETGNNYYNWVEISPSGNGDIDLSGYVPTSRKIANKELSEDITVQDLQESLETYPIINFIDYEDYTQVGEIGQLGIEGNDTWFDLYIQLGEGYGWVPIINTDRVIERSYLVSSVDENSTDNQVPSAKLFYDKFGCVREIFDEEITETTAGKYGEIVAHCPRGTFDSLYFCDRENYNDGVNKTYEWHKIYSAKAVDNLVGDIETALDSIIAIQESIIGGATE